MSKKLATKLLRELLKDSKRSDRELAQILKVSQPTITRTRHKLEKSGMIKDYTIIPDFEEMGFELLALTFLKMRPDILTPGVMEQGKEYALKWPNVIFASSGEGLGMTGVIISFHKDYSEYHHRLNLLRLDWKDLTEDIESFVVSLREGEGEFKRFSLTYLSGVPL